MKDIKYILFDTDWVVVHSDMWSNEYSRRTQLPISAMQEFFAYGFQNCLVGKADLKEVLPQYLHSWGWKWTAEEYLINWFEYENKPDTELVKVIQKLRKLYLCYVATNQEKYRLAYLSDTMGFWDNFDGIFCSAEMGVKKPEVAFFNYILEKLGTQDPSEVLYFDDAEENIKTARSLGIQCVLFRSIDDLASIMNNQ